MSYGGMEVAGSFVLPRVPTCETRNDASKRGRRRAYSTDEWERQKEHIRLLYITEKLDLNSVTVRMSEKFDFCAT
jgi:hypothetical protein